MHRHEKPEKSPSSNSSSCGQLVCRKKTFVICSSATCSRLPCQQCHEVILVCQAPRELDCCLQSSAGMQPGPVLWGNKRILHGPMGPQPGFHGFHAGPRVQALPTPAPLPGAVPSLLLGAPGSVHFGGASSILPHCNTGNLWARYRHRLNVTGTGPTCWLSCIAFLGRSLGKCRGVPQYPAAASSAKSIASFCW